VRQLHNDKMAIITVRIPDELISIIDKFCEEEDRSRSWLARKALEEKLEEWRNTKKKTAAGDLQKESRANRKKR